MADVWDENWFGSTKTLDVHIAALRRKLAAAATASGAAGAEDRDAAGAWLPAGTAPPGLAVVTDLDLAS